MGGASPSQSPLSSGDFAPSLPSQPTQRPEFKKAVDVALDLGREMEERGIPRNVHTFSALMNACIKAGHFHRALDVYEEMKEARCPLNIGEGSCNESRGSRQSAGAGWH